MSLSRMIFTLTPISPFSASNMTTPKNNHSPKRYCACPLKVDREQNSVATITFSPRTSFVGT